jgi:hypothetical protein
MSEEWQTRRNLEGSGSGLIIVLSWCVAVGTKGKPLKRLVKTVGVPAEIWPKHLETDAFSMEWYDYKWMAKDLEVCYHGLRYCNNEENNKES